MSNTMSTPPPSLSDLQQNQRVPLGAVSGLSVPLLVLRRGVVVPAPPLPAAAVQPAGVPLATELPAGPGAVRRGRGLRQLLLGPEEARRRAAVAAVCVARQGRQVRARPGLHQPV